MNIGRGFVSGRAARALEEPPHTLFTRLGQARDDVDLRPTRHALLQGKALQTVEELLGERDRGGRTSGELGEVAVDVGVEGSARENPVDESDGVRLARRDAVPTHDQL